MTRVIDVKRYAPASLSEDISVICSPLKLLDIDFFCYHKIFNDKSEIMLSNNLVWTEYFYKNKYSMGESGVSVIGNNKFNHVIWPQDTDFIILQSARQICNIYHGINLRLTGKGYYELFGFSHAQKYSVAVNNLINNIHLLEKFCIYFKHRAADIIKKSERNRISFSSKVKDSDFEDAESSIRKQFLQAIRLKKFYLSDSSLQKYLTRRELDVVSYFTKGYTMKEIGKLMDVSPRTVEDYLMNVRDKIGVGNRAQLIEVISGLEIDLL